MAFGYARSTGRLGVYTVVPGPGLLNTTAALCTAYACTAPVLCLTGQIPSAGIGTGRGYLHEIRLAVDDRFEAALRLPELDLELGWDGQSELPTSSISG